MERVAAYRKPAIWALSLAVGGVLGLLNAGSEVIDVLTGDQDFPLWEPVVWEFTSTMTIAVLAPFVIEFALRIRSAIVGRTVAVASHLLCMQSFSLLHVGGMVGMRELIYALIGRDYDLGSLGLELLYEGFKDWVTYGVIIGLTYGFDYFRRYRQRELQTVRLEAGLARAQLENLEHRIQPHFLFNTLNMISATMHENVDVADRMITRLSDLLRMSVERRGRQEVRLREELEMLSAYVEIMRARFERRLTVQIDTSDEVGEALVPPLLLQPLVENAIKFGVAMQDDDGRVDVRIRRSGNQLLIDVWDDGPGSGEPEHLLLDKGLGLSTTAERLTRLYGEAQKLTIRNAPEGGLRLSIVMPFRTTSASEVVVL